MEPETQEAILTGGTTLFDMLRYSHWSGIIALGVMIFYSIPMFFLGSKSSEKRKSFILKSDEICKLLTALFFMFSSISIIYQFCPPYCGMDDRCFRLPKVITSIASSSLFVFMAVAVTRFIKILLLNKEKNSNQNMDPIVTTPVDKVEAQSTQGHV